MINLRNIIALQIVFLGLFCGVASAYTYYHGMGSSSTYGCVFYKAYYRVHFTSVSWPGASSLEIDSDGIYRGVNEQSSFGEVWSVNVITYDSSWHEIAEEGAYFSSVAAYQSFLSQFSLTPPTECVEPNPCQDKEGQTLGESKKVEGLFHTTFCDDGCSLSVSPDVTKVGSLIGSPSYSFITNGVYTGEECPEGTPATIDPTPDPYDPDIPFPDFCDEQEDYCRQSCPNGTKINECNPVTGAYECICADPLEPEDKNPTPEKPAEKEKEPVPTASSDAEKAIINNQGKQIEQGNYLAKAVESNGKNLEAIATNTKNLNDAINDGAIGKGIEKGIDKGFGRLKRGLTGIEGELHDIQGDLSDGVYTKEAAPEAITTDEYDFSTRTNDFLSDMGETSLFGVVTDLGSLSGSGSSSIAINGGETFGDHTIDFSAFDIGLNALKYVFHLMGMIIGLRILTLKR